MRRERSTGGHDVEWNANFVCLESCWQNDCPIFKIKSSIFSFNLCFLLFQNTVQSSRRGNFLSIIAELIPLSKARH